MKKNILKTNISKKEITERSSANKPLDFLNKHSSIVSLFLITIAGIIVYSNSFNCTFHFDDNPNITQNSIIKDLSNFTNINYWLHPGRQVAYLSLALNYHFNKLEVFGYHLINLLIHIVTGIFTFLLIKLMLNSNNYNNIKFNKYKNWIPFFAALLFVVHPLQTQAVTYIVQRMASMAAMFYILSVYLYALGRIEHSKKNNLKRAIVFYIVGLISGILGVMTKENAVTFPYAMLLFEFFFIRNKENRIYKNYIIISLTTISILYILYLFLKPAILTYGMSEGINISGIDYLFNQFVVVVNYLQLTIFPINQCADYGSVAYNYPFISSFWRLDVIGCLLLLIGLIVLAVFLYQRNKILSFGIFWLFITLSV
jgi:protein O-mannosyl-transferase